MFYSSFSSMFVLSSDISTLLVQFVDSLILFYICCVSLSPFVHYLHILKKKIFEPHTVNSEIFARVLFLWNSAKITPLRNDEITLLFTGVGKSCPSREF